MSEQMRVLVYPHAMELGGSQLNAIELAAAVRDLGHSVTVYAEDGPLVDYVHELGLPYIRAATSRLRPGPAIARDIARIVREQRFDVLHGYEWPPALEMFAATLRSGHVAAVATVMSMAVSPFIPSSMPLAVGTERIRAAAQASRRGPVYLLEPPVDTHKNRPDCAAELFQGSYPDEGASPQVVIVSRLVKELKLEGILSAIRVADRLSSERKFRLVIVGDGAARAEVDRRAAAVNARHKRTVVLVTGALADPRGAYDSADICIGMGGSALRSLAFAKPLIVQGERGFFETLTPATVDMFLDQGWYGMGESSAPDIADDRLIRMLLPLLEDAAERERLGAFGLDLVSSRFSLKRMAELQEQIYREALAAPAPTARKLQDATRSSAGLIGYKASRRTARLRGRSAVDDFNARPL